MAFPSRTLEDTLPSLSIPELILDSYTTIQTFSIALKLDLETYSRRIIQDWRKTQGKLSIQRCERQTELWELTLLPLKSHVFESTWTVFGKPYQLPDWPIWIPDLQTGFSFLKVELDLSQAGMEEKVGMEVMYSELKAVEEPVLISMLHTDSHSLYRVKDANAPGIDLSLHFSPQQTSDFSTFKLKPKRVKKLNTGFNLELPATSLISFPSNFTYKDIKALNAPKTKSVFFHDDSQCKMMKTYVNLIERKELPSILTHSYQLNRFDLDPVTLISYLPHIDGLHTSETVLWERKVDFLQLIKLNDSSNRSELLKKVEARFAEMTKSSKNQIKEPAFMTPKSPKHTVCSLKIPETASSSISFVSTPFPLQTPIASSPSTPLPSIDLTAPSPELCGSLYSILENESSQFGSSFSVLLSRMIPGVNLIKVQEEHMINIDFILSPQAGIMICTADVLKTEKACSQLLRFFDSLIGRFEKLLVLCLVKETQHLSIVRKVFAFIELAKFLETEIFFEFCFSETEVEDVTRSFLIDSVCSYSLPPRPGYLATALQKCPMLNCYSAMLIETVANKEKVDLVGLISESGSGRDMLNALGIHP